MTEKQKTKELILQAATEIFHKKGFNGARMQEIADLADVNKAALHYYFNSKQKLFELVFRNSFNSLFQSFDNLVKQDLPILDKLNLLIDNYFDFVRANIQNIKFIIGAVDKNMKIIKKNIHEDGVKRNFFSNIYKEINENIKAGNIRDYNPRHLFVNIISMCIFPFIGKPVIKEVNNFSKEELIEFFQERKEMIKIFVTNALKI